jgi:hypothetical protein
MAGEQRFAVEALLPAFVVANGQRRTNQLLREIVGLNLSRRFSEQSCANVATKFRHAASVEMQNALRMQRLSRSCRISLNQLQDRRGNAGTVVPMLHGQVERKPIS